VLGGVLVLVLMLAGVILVRGVLVLLGVVADEVVRVSTAIASFLWTPHHAGSSSGCCETTKIG
jgi:hypothetical protein